MSAPFPTQTQVNQIVDQTDEGRSSSRPFLSNIPPGVALALLGLGSSLRGEDSTRAILGGAEILQQQKRQREQEELQRKQQELFKDPKYQNIATIFGPQFAFQQREQEELQKRQEEFFKEQKYQDMAKTFGVNFALQQQQADQQKQATQTALRNIGLTDQEMAFYAAGLTVKDILDLRKTGIQEKSIEQLEKEAEPDPLTTEGLENINQAFGGSDFIEQGINQLIGPIFEQPFPETSRAIRARNALNEKVREKFVNEYSGKPSVYINKRVDLLLPYDTFAAESDVANRYNEIKKVLTEGKDEMAEKIESGLYEGRELLEVQQNFKSIQAIINDLDIALSALPQPKADLDSTQSEADLDSTQSPSTGRFDSVFTSED